MPPSPLRFLLLPAVALLTHCAAPSASDAIMDRVDANRGEYETWPLTVKEAVLEGRVTRGMDPSMVRVALGKPDEQVNRGNGDVIWIYYRGDSYNVYHPPQQASRTGTYPGQPYPTSQGQLPIPQPGMRRGGQYPSVPVQEPPPLPVVTRDTRYDVEILFRDGLVVGGDGVR